MVKSFISPLAEFLPTDVPVARSAGILSWPLTRKDWSLTFLALSLFVHTLSSGLFQLKYLYAEHVYDWTAEQLSYYISFMGAVRAFHLLVLLPCGSPLNSATRTDKRCSPPGHIQTCPGNSVVSSLGPTQHQRPQDQAQIHEAPPLL